MFELWEVDLDLNKKDHDHDQVFWTEIIFKFRVDIPIHLSLFSWQAWEIFVDKFLN